ncbi:unnamed protein product [Aphanomyces euteiches]
MIRHYCVLIGTCFYYYSTQEDAEHLMRLKGEVDVIGVQDWDGKGNMHIYTNGFLFATAQNKIFYAYADTAMDKERWHRAIQMNIETNVPILSLQSSPSSISETALLSPASSVVELDVQTFVYYLKGIKQRLDSGVCLYPRPLNPEAPIELIMPMGPSHTPASTIAIDLFKQGSITAEELEELFLKFL